MGKLELAADPRFKEHTARLQDDNALAILKIIADWARTKGSGEIEELGKKYGFSASRLHSSRDMAEDVHRSEREFKKMIDDPVYGLFCDHEFPVMMSKSPPKHKWSVRPVGFDNEYIMANLLGRNQSQIDELYAAGVLGRWKDQQGRRPPADWDKSSGMILRR